jgi:hypothetical protein
VIDQLGGRATDAEPITPEQLAPPSTVVATRAGEFTVLPFAVGDAWLRRPARSRRESLGNGVRPPIASLADCVRTLDASERPIDQSRMSASAE